MNMRVGSRKRGGDKRSREEMGSGPSSACRATKKGKKRFVLLSTGMRLWGNWTLQLYIRCVCVSVCACVCRGEPKTGVSQ